MRIMQNDGLILEAFRSVDCVKWRVGSWLGGISGGRKLICGLINKIC